MRVSGILLTGAAAMAFLADPVSLRAQTGHSQPSHAFVVTGYGTAGALKTEEIPSTYFASLNPIFLFQMSPRFLAEAELEIELEEGGSVVGLEYVNVNFVINDHLTATAGKFLLPFGVFGQRLHPTWINRFVSTPPIYGHHGGIPGVDPLLPILSDIGVMASAVAPLGGYGRSVIASAFLTNGPMAEHAEEAGDGGEEGEEAHGPELGFGESVEDNNDNKMLGGRLGLVLGPNFEVDLSGMWSRWGRAEQLDEPLDFWGYNAAAELRRGPLEVRGEWLRTGTQFEEVHGDGDAELATIHRWGGYAQATYRIGAWEPVLRFALVEPNEDEADDRLYQYGFGLNYWFTPSVVVMAAFELNDDSAADGADLDNNRLLIHWAFGF